MLLEYKHTSLLGCFCIRFIDFMLNNKISIDFTLFYIRQIILHNIFGIFLIDVIMCHNRNFIFCI